ncbi:STAS domain-containing protein [Rhodovulum sp. 12E13]|uniref:STAS domain-containing protein n=1 Tax=Rhodovulum sp. 12E13 TaxID=2203891 RepID=UPI000E19DED5|nr:STAS domain-containing protein [Rhodovulum sp. 12E13]RDC74528.1 STAS domain-containing protein [Rhodovulum sp. 12E13]
MSAPATFPLPARLDLSTAAMLAEGLRAHRGADLALDAGDLTHLGTPGLQVLLSARRSWGAAGHALSIENAPETLAEQLAQFGLREDDLVTAGATARAAGDPHPPPEPPPAPPALGAPDAAAGSEAAPEVSAAPDTTAEIASPNDGDGQQTADPGMVTYAGPDLPAPGEAPAAAAADLPDLSDLSDLSAPDLASPAGDDGRDAATTDGDTTEGDRS